MHEQWIGWASRGKQGKFMNRFLEWLISSLIGTILFIIFLYLEKIYPPSPILILCAFLPLGVILLHAYIYWKTPPLKRGWFVIGALGMASMTVGVILGPAGIILLPTGLVIWLFSMAKAYKQ
jgi:hypothetical protein